MLFYAIIFTLVTENRHPCNPDPCQFGECSMKSDLMNFKCTCEPG